MTMTPEERATRWLKTGWTGPMQAEIDEREQTLAAEFLAAEIEALEWAASKAEAHAARHHGPEGILHAEMMALGIRNEINDEIARRQKEKP